LSIEQIDRGVLLELPKADTVLATVGLGIQVDNSSVIGRRGSYVVRAGIDGRAIQKESYVCTFDWRRRESGIIRVNGDVAVRIEVTKHEQAVLG